MSEDLKQYRRQFQKEYGWFIMGKEVSKYTGADYFTVMTKPAVEVLGIMVIMRAEIEMTK